MKTNPSRERFCPNVNDSAEIYALGGVGKLLDNYQRLIDAVKSKSTQADKSRAENAEQLRAAKAFLFAVAGMESRAEFASASYDSCAPKGKRKEIAARATVILDDALAALKSYDLADTMRNVF